MALQTKQNSKIGRIYPIIGDLTVAPFKFISQDIASWRKAIDSARSTTNPRRKLLHELYESILLDGKLQTVYQKRKVGVTNKRIVFVDKNKEGTPNEKVMDDIVNQVWFDEMIGYLVDKTFWGHTLIELVPGTETKIGAVNRIPPTNVMPEKQWLLMHHNDYNNGIPYAGEGADPAFQKYLIEFGKPKEYGLLMTIAQYVIYKRGGFGDWAQFAEIFGMPFRIGKYDPFDPKTRTDLLQALGEMGGAGYAAIPEGTSIEFHNGNSNTGQSAVFNDLIKMCNDEIAQIVLGGTMTTDNGSSHSQSETHKDGENEIIAADLKEICNWLNSKFKQHLIDHFGYSELKNGHFKVESNEVLSLKDRIIIDEKVANQVEIDPEYWYKTYNVLMPKQGPTNKTTPPAQNQPPQQEVKKKSNLSMQLSQLYEHSCKTCLRAGIPLTLSNEGEVERLARAIYDGKLKTGDVDKKLLKQTAKALMDGIMQVGDDAFNQLDPALQAVIKENVFVFSGFKTHSQLKKASELLLDADGAIKSFTDFKAAVLELDQTYNTTYLAAEYNHAVASSQMAVKWQSFEKAKANLKYVTAGDNRVTPADAALDGITLPYDNSFWDKNYPPRHWGCRCNVEEADGEGITDLSTKTIVPAPEMFQNNVGKEGIVFPKQHPYFDESNKTIRNKITKAAKEAMDE
jgi:SPP1 gp7 family putative phage head morphogenesis protein